MRVVRLRFAGNRECLIERTLCLFMLARVPLVFRDDLQAEDLEHLVAKTYVTHSGHSACHEIQPPGFGPYSICSAAAFAWTCAARCSSPSASYAFELSR